MRRFAAITHVIARLAWGLLQHIQVTRINAISSCLLCRSVMNVKLDSLQIGFEYTRPFLSTLWSYQGHQALSRGVVIPRGSRAIILFVTSKKQSTLKQYNDFVDGNLLFWEGEDKHGSDQKIIMAKSRGEQIYLFYRARHHAPFVYFGRVDLLEFQQNNDRPSEFIFRIVDLPETPDALDEITSRSHEFQALSNTEKRAIIKSRIGQGSFRENLIKLWGGCSVTTLTNLSLLRASHIKPWRDSNNLERLSPYNGLLLVPNFDLLFDRGLIGFREDGEILISHVLTQDERKIFHLSSMLKLRKVFPDSRIYFEYHRDKVFIP